MRKALEIDGKTRTLAILGWPLHYTLSPLFQNAALRSMGLQARYLPLAVESPEAFRLLAAGLMASPHFVGANVTNPYKTEVLKLVKHRSAAVKAIGAANTLVRRGSAWEAHNTDAPGFMAAATAAGAKVRAARVLILGAGGAARAIAWACAQAGAKEVAVLARRESQAKSCAKVAKNKGFGAGLNLQNVSLASQAATWIVNTLPGDVGEAFAGVLAKAEPGAWAMDINYLPQPRTAFLKQASKAGYRTLDGLPMLLEQGRLSLKLWFGKSPSRVQLAGALKKSLR